MEKLLKHEVQIKVNHQVFKQQIMFIRHLQTDCILGMDFLSAANISLDTHLQKIKFGQTVRDEHVLFSTKQLHLPAMT